MIRVRVAFKVIGEFEHGAITTRWVPQTRPFIPEIEDHIQRSWTEAQARPGINLFDGPMCRLERFTAAEKLHLDLSPTSYKIFWGTNLNNAAFAKKYGPDILANAVGLSCALESADGYLM